MVCGTVRIIVSKVMQIVLFLLPRATLMVFAYTGSGNSHVVIKGGNVGIGTTSPSSELEVNGSLEISPAEPTIHLNRSNGSYSWKIINGSGTGNFPISTFNIAVTLATQ